MKIIEDGRTPRWRWIIQWCLDKQRMPSQQPWWLKGYKASLKHFKDEHS